MVKESQVHEVLSRLYFEFVDDMDFESDLAKRGAWQWNGVSKDMRLGAEYAMEAVKNSFLEHFKEACRTVKN